MPLSRRGEQGGHGRGQHPSKDLPRAEELIPWLVAGLALLVTLPALRGGFVWDDRWLLLQSPLRTSPELLGQVVMGGHGWGTMLGPEEGSAYFRPLVGLLHGLMLIVFGAHPLPFHILSSLLHAGTAFVLALWLRRRSPGAAWAAAAFALHPALADATGWISAAPDLMAAFFVLALLVALDREPRRVWVLGLLWFLALASKESAAMGILWLPLIGLWHPSRVGKIAPADRPMRADMPATPRPGRSVPGGATMAALVLGGIAYLVLRALGPGFHPPIGEYPAGVEASRVQLVGRLFLFNFWRLLVPVQPTLSPAPWVVQAGRGWIGYSGIVLGLGLSGISLWRLWGPFRSAAGGLSDHRRSSVVAPSVAAPLALAFLLCTTALLPILQILPANDVFGGRYLYLPAAGLCLGLGLALSRLTLRANAIGWGRGLGLVLLLAFGVQAILRAGEWRDEERLFGSEYRRMASGIRGPYQWGSFLLNHGRTEEARPVIEQLFREFPAVPSIQALTASLWMNEGRVAQAEPVFARLVRSWRRTPTLLANLGACQMRLGRVEEGLATLDEATRISTPTPGMRNNRGLALELLGRPDEARREFVQAIREDPTYQPARVNLIRLLVRASERDSRPVRTSRPPRPSGDSTDSGDFGDSGETAGTDRERVTMARGQAEEFLRLFPHSSNAAAVRAMLDTLRAR